VFLTIFALALFFLPPPADVVSGLVGVSILGYVWGFAKSA
jgi:hypothetical protein